MFEGELTVLAGLRAYTTRPALDRVTLTETRISLARLRRAPFTWMVALAGTDTEGIRPVHRFLPYLPIDLLNLQKLIYHHYCFYHNFVCLITPFAQVHHAACCCYLVICLYLFSLLSLSGELTLHYLHTETTSTESLIWGVASSRSAGKTHWPRLNLYTWEICCYLNLTACDILPDLCCYVSLRSRTRLRWNVIDLCLVASTGCGSVA